MQGRSLQFTGLHRLILFTVCVLATRPQRLYLGPLLELALMPMAASLARSVALVASISPMECLAALVSMKTIITFWVAPTTETSSMESLAGRG
jgi:hypothetical protein